MGLKIGAADGSTFYLDTTEVVVNTASESETCTLSYCGFTVTLKIGQEVEVANGVIVTLEGKSSNSVCRLSVHAPERVSVLRGEVFSQVLGATRGFLVAKPVYDWLRDFAGLDKDAVHEKIFTAELDHDTGKLISEEYIFGAYAAVIQTVTRNEA